MERGDLRLALCLVLLGVGDLQSLHWATDSMGGPHRYQWLISLLGCKSYVGLFFVPSSWHSSFKAPWNFLRDRNGVLVIRSPSSSHWS